MTTRSYPQWTPPLPDADPLSDQVADREDERVVADPEAGTEGETIVVHNRPPQPVPAYVDHGQDIRPAVERVDATAHLQGGEPSTDRHSDDVLDALEPIPWHKGVFRRFNAQGREAFSIAYIDSAGNRRVQPVDARDLDGADQALAEALQAPGRQPIR